MMLWFITEDILSTKRDINLEVLITEILSTKHDITLEVLITELLSTQKRYNSRSAQRDKLQFYRVALSGMIVHCQHEEEICVLECEHANHYQR